MAAKKKVKPVKKTPIVKKVKTKKVYIPKELPE